MRYNKKRIWDQKFSDNYKPNLIEKIIKKYETPRQKVISTLLPKKLGVLLDIACGNGVTVLMNASRYKQLIGLDISKSRIQKAILKSKSLGVSNVKFKYCDIDRGIPLKSGSVDACICEASLSYFYNMDFVLSEVNRVLKKSGKFIVEVPNYAFVTRRIALFFGNLPKTSSFPGLGDGGALRYFTYSTLRKFFVQNGFKVLKETNSGVLSGWRKLYPPLFAGDIIFLATKDSDKAT